MHVLPDLILCLILILEPIFFFPPVQLYYKNLNVKALILEERIYTINEERQML